jgi:peptidyl-prolyl cis-trans isomerase B (cyclophilin B)
MKSILILSISLIFSFAAIGQDRTKVLISTSKGDMIVELYNETPLHRDNFITLVKSGYLNQTLFHRVIPGFMIQGGDPNSKNAKPNIALGNGGPGYTIDAEFNPNLFHKKGALAAARKGDAINPKKASSGSQFYIVDGSVYNTNRLDLFEQRLGNSFSKEQKEIYTTIGGTPSLDGSYTVFGQVIKGLEVISKIANMKRDANDRPIQDLKMKLKIIK